MSKIDRVSNSIVKLRSEGLSPSKIRMSRSFAVALKDETIPNINQYFVGGRMTISDVPWEIDNSVRGYVIESSEIA